MFKDIANVEINILRPIEEALVHLNLCLQDVSRKYKILRNKMDFIHDLVQLTKFSPRRLTVFEKFRKEITVSSGDSTPSL